MHAQSVTADIRQQSDTADNAADADICNYATATTASSDTSDRCEVCLAQPRAGRSLVPCGHSRFYTAYADTVASIDSGSPIF